MRKKTAATVIFMAILTVAIVLVAILSQPKPADYSISAKSFSILDSEQWIYEEFQGRRFQMVTYEENKTKKIFLIQVDWFFGPGFRWQVNEGHWYRDGARVAISSGLNSNFTAERLDEDYMIGGLPNLEYAVSFGDFQMYTSFSFNTNAYNNVTHAWRNSELEMFWKVD